MKFLCVSCDEQMKIARTIPPQEGQGITVLYGCPACGREIGMLTNPWETQVVSSLGVRIGGSTVDELRAESAGEAEGEGRLSKCPFSEMVNAMPSDESLYDERWTPEASRRLQNIPDFVRPMARQGIEEYARSKGYSRIDERVLDECKEVFGM